MTITAELKSALVQAGEEPVLIVDPETQEAYVVLKADVYHRLRSLIEPDIRDAYALTMKVFGTDGWDDPIMDEYNALDPRRS